RAMNESDDGRAQWVTSRGRVLPGLVKRRAEERSLCEQDL
ncbi:lysozyme, partial [Caballeronia sp. LZ001]|nr:lysozyme [Caballeronia sp. LZ001]